MPKVLGIVSFRIYPTHMGGQKGVAHFYESLQRKMDIKLAVSDDNVYTERVSLEKILFPNRRIPANFIRLNKLIGLARAFGAEMIIAEHSYTGWLAWLCAKKLNIPFVVHSHNIESRRFQKMNKWWWKLYAGYEKFIHRKANHNFFISKEDQDFAISNFGINSQRCSVITYGIGDINFNETKAELKKKLQLDQYDHILLFNGTLDYTPNYEAAHALMDNLLPILRSKLKNFLLVITGNRAPHDLALKMLNTKDLLYTGYVEDVNQYYQAADIFINPVANDTGVKTKLIEALANNCTTVSTMDGAAGIRTDLCGDKLVIVSGNDWNAFVDAMLAALEKDAKDTPKAFYDYYKWDAIAERASLAINETIERYSNK